jgi:hypothetical protein
MMGPRSNLSALSAEPRTARRTKRWPLGRQRLDRDELATAASDRASKSNEWDVAIQQSLAGSAGPVAAASPGSDPLSLADPPTVKQILGAAGFIGANFTDVDEPVYYGPEVAAALDWVRGFTCTNEVLNRLDPSPRRAHSGVCGRRSPPTKATTVSGSTPAWIITARRH